MVGIGPALFGALVAFHGVDRNVNGMEGALSLLAAAALVWLLMRWDRGRDVANLVAVGLAASALVLARLDYGLVIGVVPVTVALRSRSWRDGLTVAGALARRSPSS
jgi:hypothetical protein